MTPDEDKWYTVWARRITQTLAAIIGWELGKWLVAHLAIRWLP